MTVWNVAWLLAAWFWLAGLVAILYGANGLIPEKTTPLLMLLDQPGPIRAYKLVKANMEGPFT